MCSKFCCLSSLPLIQMLSHYTYIKLLLWLPVKSCVMFKTVAIIYIITIFYLATSALSCVRKYFQLILGTIILMKSIYMSPPYTVNRSKVYFQNSFAHYGPHPRTTSLIISVLLQPCPLVEVA